MESLKKREYWIDAVRSFACICVLMTHSPIPSTVEGRTFIPIYNFVAVGGASILFFMISGALVLYRRQEFFYLYKEEDKQNCFTNGNLDYRFLDCGMYGRKDGVG